MRTKTGERIGCKIHNNLPWHSQQDIAEFFGKSIKTISEHTVTAPAKDVLNLTCTSTEGVRTVTRTIKHYSFNYVAGLCYRIRSFHHTERYRAFLAELGIVWAERVPVPCDEKNFSVYLSEIFKGVLDIDFEYRMGPYRVDGYVKKLNLVFELDGKGHRKVSARVADRKRETYIRNLGVDIIRAPLGEYTAIANQLIQRMQAQ